MSNVNLADVFHSLTYTVHILSTYYFAEVISCLWSQLQFKNCMLESPIALCMLQVKTNFYYTLGLSEHNNVHVGLSLGLSASAPESEDSDRYMCALTQKH